MNTEMTEMVIKLIIALVSVIITGYLIPYLRTKMDSTKYADMLEFIRKFVESANQIYTPEQWMKKKEYVLNLVEKYADEHGVTITDEEINALIEGFVIAVKGENNG